MLDLDIIKFLIAWLFLVIPLMFIAQTVVDIKNYLSSMNHVHGAILNKEEDIIRRVNKLTSTIEALKEVSSGLDKNT